MHNAIYRMYKFLESTIITVHSKVTLLWIRMYMYVCIQLFSRVLLLLYTVNNITIYTYVHIFLYTNNYSHNTTASFVMFLLYTVN